MLSRDEGKRDRLDEAVECERMKKRRRRKLTTSNVEIKHTQNEKESGKQ